MKATKISPFGLEVDYQIPSTVDEFDQNAKRVGACLDEATKNILYRGVFSDVRYIFLHGDEEKDEAGKVVRSIKGLDDLTGKERDLLVLLMKNVGRVCARERLLNSVWGLDSDPLTNVVDVTVSRIRRKLGDAADIITTIRNYGYRLDG
jgi:hypothetical protein